MRYKIQGRLITCLGYYTEQVCSNEFTIAEFTILKTLREIILRFRSINCGLIAMLMLTFAFTSCEYEDEWSPYKSKAVLSGTLLTYHPSSISGTTSGDPSYLWVLQVLEGKEFCSFVSQSGYVGNPFTINLTANMSGVERQAVVRITFTDGYTNTFTIRQMPMTDNPTYDRPWAEQPAQKSGESLVYKTYYTKLSGNKLARNYSICYDTGKLVPHWVAYPLHNCYIGNSGRTDEWSFDDAYYTYNSSSGDYVKKYVYTDPVIPTTLQQNIEAGGYQGNGDRGHMLPSASRTVDYNTNAQTFYATNMMPQYSQFNQGVWAALENDVRSWRCADTLYVVTGTLYETGSYQFTARGRKITSPSHAFKLVLRTRSGKSNKNIADISSADELMCIGFLFSNNSTGANTSIRDAAVSVAEIERRSGFKFFNNIRPEIADEVKSQKNLSDWGLR